MDEPTEIVTIALTPDEVLALASFLDGPVRADVLGADHPLVAAQREIVTAAGAVLHADRVARRG